MSDKLLLTESDCTQPIVKLRKDKVKFKKKKINIYEKIGEYKQLPGRSVIVLNNA